MQRHQITFLNFDTVNTISIFGHEEILDEVRQSCARYEELFSRFRTGSDIWNINHAKGKKTVVSSETADLIRMAVDYSRQTDGAFDITVGGMTALWDFSGETIQDPKVSKLRRQAALAGFERIEIEQNTVRVPTDVQLDLGGIAKGYITDMLVQTLRQGGVTSGLINLGGNIYAMGVREDGAPWRVGIQEPKPASYECSTTVEIQDQSVVTSGIYERGYRRGSHWNHHILDVKTGLPIDNELAAVTIVCDRSVEADAYSTAALCLGEERTRALLNGKTGFRAFFQRKEGSNSWL